MMWANVLTKPKQGGPFRFERSHLMNIPINYDDDVERIKLTLSSSRRMNALNKALNK